MNTAVPEDARKVHSRTFSPPWGNMDALGHINNARYFDYCAQSRVEWFGELGHLGYLSGKSPTGPVVVNAACTYLRQFVYPCRLEISMFAGRPGRSSFDTWYEIRNADTGDLHTTGRAKIVWVDYGAEKSIPIPEEIRSILD